ncbi:hypothetical protein S-CBS4_gp023 [Synechococcus phage S-CBS4]|uniref:hypothetical protein n=1 Tax=Synechococcus phage S-CBS4 TaxID=756275 RepID=UPI000246A6EF|nr:hypothetical protein S-CBS4_gp023 [Synechococcus phage S-CBS4]AEX55990.1 hypothetical protein S-CBS4_gp023 [Synechococcus phage S-CBS4]AGN30531.1 hypothetical protein SXAG_00084 [Synechococcus phage S-CBS4]
MAVTFTPTPGAGGGVQSSYELELTAALEGQFADIANNNVATFINETGAGIAYGDLLVVNGGGTVGNSAKTIAATGDTVVGVNALTYIEESSLDANGRPAASDTQALNVVNQGVVAVYVTGAVDLTSPVRVYYTTHTGTTAGAHPGRFSHAFVSGKTRRLTGARWVSKTTGAGIALLELNGPDFTLAADS